MCRARVPGAQKRGGCSKSAPGACPKHTCRGAGWQRFRTHMRANQLVDVGLHSRIAHFERQQCRTAQATASLYSLSGRPVWDCWGAQARTS